MRLPEVLRLYLLGKAQGVMESRKPDLLINGGQVERWMVYPKNQWRNIYVHKFNGPDPDEALHDHEPDNVSLILKNAYMEEFHVKPLETELLMGELRYRTYMAPRQQGEIVFRLASTPHRVRGVYPSEPVITMFLQGPRRRKWGFWCPSGWKPWDQYIDVKKGYGDRSGKGCG